MAQVPQHTVDAFEITQGLNTSKSGIRVGPQELKNAQNIRYSPIGGFKWRKGYTTLGNEPGQAATGLFMFRFSSGTNVAFRMQGSKVEKMDALDGTWDDITGAVTLTVGQNNHFSAAILNDIVIAVNGVDTPVQISSSLVTTDVSGLPFSTAKQVFVYRQRMFYITDDTVYFSDINDPVTVGANSFISVANKQGGEIIGGVDYRGTAYIWKRSGIHAIEFQPTRVNSAGDLFPFIEVPNSVAPGVGAQSPRSIIKFTTPSTHQIPGQELVFFVDQFGTPRIFDGQQTRSLGVPIKDSRDDSIISLTSTNKTQIQYTWCLDDPVNNLIYCAMSSTGNTQHDIVWVLDYNTLFAWSRDSYDDTMNVGTLFEKNDGTFKHYFADYLGQVYEMDSGQSDNGTAIVSKARGGDLFVQSPSIKSSWLQTEVRGQSGDDTQEVSITYYPDGDDSISKTDSIILFKDNQSNWDEVNWDEFNWAYSGLTTKTREINLFAKTLSIEFSNSVLNNTAVVEGYSLFVDPKGVSQE